MKQVSIIGAGIGGLATANLLQKAGYQVTIYEQHERPGGRAGLLEKDGFTFDTGPSWYLMPEVFEHYYDLLGRSVDDELELTRLDPAYKVFFQDNEPVLIQSDPQKTADLFEQIEFGAGRQFLRYIARSSSIYKLAVEHFLYTNFQSFRDFLKPRVLANSGLMLYMAIKPIHGYVSRFVRDSRLKQILEYPMVFLGASPFKAPALYSLMSALDFEEGVFYPKGGLYSVIRSLESIGQSLGVQYVYNAPVESIRVADGKAVGIVLRDGSSIDADLVISNADLQFTETALLKPPHQSYPQSYWDKKQASPSALLVYLGVKGELPFLEHHNLFFAADWRANFEAIYNSKKLPEVASMYVCKPSQTDLSVAPAGYQNVFVLVPIPAGVSLTEAEQDSHVAGYLAQIEAMSGETFTERIVSKTVYGPDYFSRHLNAWQSTMLGPSHILSQSALFRTPNKSKKVKNLHYVGAATLPGIGLPMCLIGAELLYKRLANDRRGGRVERIERLV